MTMTGFDTDNPLLDYAKFHLWGNPEENHQYQVKTVRLTDYYGDIDQFNYMGKWRSLPKRNNLFYVFSVNGLDPGYWNFRTKTMRHNPLDRWINLGELMARRGVQLDIYNAKGYQYSKYQAWVMMTYDGITLIALEKTKAFPLPAGDEIYFRCYTPTVPVAAFEQISPTTNPYVYETMIYETPAELAVFNNRYLAVKAKAGWTGVYHNGAYWNAAPAALPGLAVGDVVEFIHDPTVIRTEIYSYKNLQDFYSTLDQKRKVILHPAKRANDFTIRYFDDNDYFLLGTGNYGLYFHRNDTTTIRQLTHADVAIADDRIQAYSSFHPALAKTSDIRVLVLVRKTDWEYPWPHDHQRIRYLYRMTDAAILKAMTGPLANVPEWTAPGLEAGAVMSFTRAQCKQLSREGARDAVGYNAATRVLSETPLRATYQAGQRGIEIPFTYRESLTAWEYDENGKLLQFLNLTNTRYYEPRNTACAMVEFTYGQAGRKLDYTITNQDLAVNPSNDFRVYVSNYSIVSQKIVGELVDVTGDETIYTVNNGYIVWTGLDTVNQRGVVLFNTRSLAYSFELDHIDHSLSFAITHIYEAGGLIFPVAFANCDLWLNDFPLIDHVDWTFKDQYFYIYNKQHIKAGAQKITVRMHQFSPDKDNPVQDTELGFVDGGVIGRFPRYNLRDDRVTRTVIGGGLYLTDEVPNAETSAPSTLLTPLNGRPYMVKHVYCPIRYVEPYNNFYGYDESRAVDKRVSDYLTKYLPKPSSKPALPTLQDKWRLFSPFLSVVVNAIINRILVLPAFGTGETEYSQQEIRELVAPYMWWLEFDPVIREFDQRYFAIMPYANYEKLTVSAKTLKFINQVNDSYLKSVCVIEGHFNVNNNAV